MSTATLDTPDVVPHGTRPDYWAGHKASPEQINEWVEQFHRDGYLLIPKVLPLELCARLRADLDKDLGVIATPDQSCELRMRMFERSAANLSLFDLEPIVTFAERLIATETHVIHNNSFQTNPGQGITSWHQDDPPHLLVTSGEPPTNIRLPVLFFTCNYYLTDVDEVANGGTECIPRSHMLGAPCPGDASGPLAHVFKGVAHNLAPAGSVVMFNNQVWHRGGPNTSARTRYVTQITYARRIIGHKYAPFMNYQMPEHIHAGANPRLKRLLGFLSNGAYG
jgi:ectoine hydroxylase-related dioxygenase (phytanoyl-CoA dioxygenase family)